MKLIERTYTLPKNVFGITVIDNSIQYYCESWCILLEVVELVKTKKSECKKEYKNQNK